jgi:hypothetical protein
VGLLCNLAVRKVDPRHHYDDPEELDPVAP